MNRNKFVLLFLIVMLSNFKVFSFTLPKSAYIIVLGVAQDGGYPHLGCQKECCTQAWNNPTMRRNVVSLALVDPISKKWWLFEATPDIKQQIQSFRDQTNSEFPYLPEGVFITHAHIGHYTGLMQFGKEVMNTNKLKVYVLPKMKTFLEQNGPWSQLVKLNNIVLINLAKDSTILLKNISVTPFTVPHRDEFSETAGFKIATPTKKYLFIPDIDKWSKWEKNIIEEVKNVDIALLDATFYTSEELPGRAISEVPHPMVIETKKLFNNQPLSAKKKIVFIHFNHTNPLLWNKTVQKNLKLEGFNFATEGQIL